MTLIECEEVQLKLLDSNGRPYSKLDIPGIGPEFPIGVLIIALSTQR